MKIIATYFSPLILLHCHNQVDKKVTLISRLFCFVTKMPALKLLEKNVVCKLQNSTLLDTNRVALVEHCIALNVPNPFLNQEMI